MTITVLILIITCVVSFPLLNNEEGKEKVLFWPYQINHKKEYFRFFSGALVHADLMHLAFNMMTLYSFGTAIENFLYPVYFQDKARILYVSLYVLGALFASIPDYIKYRNVYGYRALGASGAVSAILLEPSMPLRFFFIPIDIPGWLFGIAFLALSAYLAKKGNDNIGHSAHFWGGVFGLVFTYIAVRAYTDVNVLERFVKAVF
jgi:membrane associated rhomboid family serine protease